MVAYIGLHLFLALWVGDKVKCKTKVVNLKCELSSFKCIYH